MLNRAAAAACLLFAVQAAWGATTCRILGGGNVNFGPYDTLSSVPTDTAGVMQVRCNRVGGPRSVTLTVTLSTGTNGTAVNNRRMRQVGGTGDLLDYGLFRDVGRSSVWGFTPGVDAVSQVLVVPNFGSALATFTIYARIPALQNVSPGTYADSVQITLTP